MTLSMCSKLTHSVYSGWSGLQTDTVFDTSDLMLHDVIEHALSRNEITVLTL